MRSDEQPIAERVSQLERERERRRIVFWACVLAVALLVSVFVRGFVF